MLRAFLAECQENSLPTYQITHLPNPSRCLPLLGLLLHFLLHLLNLHSLFLNVQAQMCVEAHILIGNPDQGKAANQVSAPVIEQEFVAREPQKKDCHVVAEAVFTGKNKKELAPEKSRVPLALVDTIVAGLFEDLFMGHRPRNGSDGKGQQKQPDDLDG